MDQNELVKQLRSIVEKHARVSVPPPPTAATCWLDGDNCPYGIPNGRFQDRPLQICHLREGGCQKLKYQEEVFVELLGDYVEDEVKRIIEETCETNKVTLSSELKVIAEDCDEESPEQQTLKLAADILEGQPYNTEIMRVDDI